MEQIDKNALLADSLELIELLGDIIIKLPAGLPKLYELGLTDNRFKIGLKNYRATHANREM